MADTAEALLPPPTQLQFRRFIEDAGDLEDLSLSIAEIEGVARGFPC
jgi:hypothetical protein